MEINSSLKKKIMNKNIVIKKILHLCTKIDIIKLLIIQYELKSS